ncbi:MAG: hypothetical protein KI791_12865 [Cyclobacteriaceae bacterium]|nr:hypothetical protein [Cyclobacteriaceae bacterium SS2]
MSPRDKKYAELIKKQISKLDNEQFDLDAWKSSAYAVIKRIFGDFDPRLKQIEGLRIDYSSWTLRDSSAKYKPLESSKNIGREIMQSALEEIEVFGMDTDSNHDFEKYFDDTALKTLQDPNASPEDKLKIIKKLKKSDLENIVASLF